MRMTYRTLRVLATIEAQAGLSNYEVAQRAGISDQGQISRLLSRLHGLGLIENTGKGQSKGGANAWQLTREGRRLQSATGRASRRAAP